jgi:trimeric autotransporter adhesin
MYMFVRRCLKALLLAGVALSISSCSSPSLVSIAITPTTQYFSYGAGLTVQFTAIGTFAQGNHPKTTKDITNEVTWKSNTPDIATISSSGLLTTTGAAYGTTNITASMNGFTGVVTANASANVCAPGDTVTSTGCTAPSTPTNLASIVIIPTSQTVLSVNETGQFIAIGSLNGGAVIDLTNTVKWSSSDVKVATIDANGLATGLNIGTTTITALATDPNGSILGATATFTVQPASGSGTILPTLTVYKVGNNAATGTVTAPDPSTGTGVINCGTGAGCTGNFAVGTAVTLTATPGPNSTFGGWSSNCAVTDTSKPNQCTLVMTDNATVGAIFN